MHTIIMNLHYSISLECLFATLGQAVSAWKYLDVDISDVYIKTLNNEKAKIEYAKKAMDTMKARKSKYAFDIFCKNHN